MANPGAVVARIPAGSTIRPVRTWEVHVAPGGYTVVGTNEAAAVEVTLYFPFERSGTEYVMTEFGVRVSPDVTEAIPEILSAAAEDMASNARPSGAPAPASDLAATLHVQDDALIGAPATLLAAGGAGCPTSAAAKRDPLKEYIAISNAQIQRAFILGTLVGGGVVGACALALGFG